MVRVLEGSGRVGVGVDGGRSVEGLEGRLGEDMVGVTAFDGMVRVGGVGGRGEMVGVEGGATGVADLDLLFFRRQQIRHSRKIKRKSSDKPTDSEISQTL